MPDINLTRIFKNTLKLGVLTAIFGPLLLGVAQCSHDNDYDPWDKRALNSYGENVRDTYYWEMKQGRKVLEFVGDKLPEFKP